MNLPFWKINAHLLPGFLATSLIIISLNDEKLNWLSSSQVAFEATFFILASLFVGLIVDSIHHRVLSPIYKSIIEKNINDKVNDTLKRDAEILTIYGKDILDRIYSSFYEPSEAYTNIALALFAAYYTLLVKWPGKCVGVLFLIILFALHALLFYSGYKSRKKHYCLLNRVYKISRKG